MINDEQLGRAISKIASAFDDELFAKKEAELEENWFFVWDDCASLEENLYRFHNLLKLYGSQCRRWEEKHNGSMCIVERVRDKYLMPKIRELARHLTTNSTPTWATLPEGQGRDSTRPGR